ncbi:MAG: hypothetical protein ACRBBU_09490 [Pseudooceanicola sp.]
MDDGARPSAPNYTTAALWMGLINLLWVLGVIWALFGLPAVILTAWVMDRLIQRLPHRG